MSLPIRLLALDIDGTLLNSKFKISALDAAALRRTHELGVEIILCTGRRHTFAMPIASLLGFELWLCTSNGAITRSLGGETFHRELLPLKKARRFFDSMRDFQQNMVITFDKEERGALVVDTEHRLEQRVTQWLLTNAPYIQMLHPIDACLIADPIQTMICGPIGFMRAVQSAIEQLPFRADYTVLKTEYPHRDLCLLDVLNNGCSKGHALERWADFRGISRQEIMAIGDNYNDLEMLHVAGVPVVMGNAEAEMKQHGFTETSSNDEHGVAAALQQVLGRKLLDLEELAGNLELMK
jgi:Cof subfamily protein (haloacid dehalogenase superfamily)